MADTHPCLGLEFLGQCSYNPAAPYAVYFSLGEVIGALAFTLAVQQLLKPIYQFRLQARHLSVQRLYLTVFLGVTAVLIASLVPSITILHGAPWGYALVWELAGAFLFAAAYGAVIWSVVRPVAVAPRRMVAFCQASAELLSSAGESDHVDYASDMVRSLPALIAAASILDRWGKPTAFYEFRFRRELERGRFAYSLMRVFADSSFCQTLVRKTPWQLATMLRELSVRQLHAGGADQFIRELARQAVMHDESMMAREIGYQGFATAPLLSQSLFGSAFIVEVYDPFDWILFGSSPPTAAILKRFNRAVELAVTALIVEERVHQVQALNSINHFYEDLFRSLQIVRETGEQNWELLFEIRNCAVLSLELSKKLERRSGARVYNLLFQTTDQDYDWSVLDRLVENVFLGLSGISNDFKGHKDLFWFMAINLISTAFPKHSDEPDGLSPFQQRLAIKLIERLRKNMDGMYEPISRILLSCIGPYDQTNFQKNRTAFSIFKDAVYAELKLLPSLAAQGPNQVRAYLPDNVEFDSSSATLIHTYADGQTTRTDLASLALVPISLISESLFQTQQKEKEGNR